MSFLRKEILLETRDPRVVSSLLALASVVGVFGGLGISRALLPLTYSTRVIPVLWICFAALLTLFAVERSFEHEREDRALEGALIIRKRNAQEFFLSKVFILSLIGFFSSMYLFAVLSMFSSLSVSLSGMVLVSVAAMLSIGVVTIGLFVGSMTSETKARLILLPVIGLPLLSPLMFACIEVILDSLSGAELLAHPWFWFSLTLDLVYVALTTCIFPSLIKP